MASGTAVCRICIPALACELWPGPHAFKTHARPSLPRPSYGLRRSCRPVITLAENFFWFKGAHPCLPQHKILGTSFIFHRRDQYRAPPLYYIGVFRKEERQMLAENLMEYVRPRHPHPRHSRTIPPTAQFELMLNSLAHQEAALTAAFSATLRARLWKLYICSSRQWPEVVFRMSDFDGFVAANDYSASRCISI